MQQKILPDEKAPKHSIKKLVVRSVSVICDPIRLGVCQSEDRVCTILKIIIINNITSQYYTIKCSCNEYDGIRIVFENGTECQLSVT